MNISECRYVPFLKTQLAELRAVKELDAAVKRQILPFVLLTKSRSNGKNYAEKHPEKIDGDIDKNIEKWADAFGDGAAFFLDLSSEEAYQNSQILDLLSPMDGYSNWVSFVREKRKQFSKLIPVIQINSINDESDGQNLKLQIDALFREFDYVGYREEIYASEDTAEDYAGYIQDTLSSVIGSNGMVPSKLILILDVGYLQPDKHERAAEKVSAILGQLASLHLKNVIVTGTSFPLTLSDFVEDQKANEYEGDLRSETIPMYQKVLAAGSDEQNLVYGDYALIHPVKKVGEIYARGWIPRIDVSCGKVMYFVRRRKKKDGAYSDAYQEVAYKITGCSWFEGIPECWGKDKICDAAWGSVEQTVPRFWVAVRANTHITTMVRLAPTCRS